MFCYAFGYALAKQRGAELWLDTTMLDRQQVNGRTFELDGYKIEYDKRISYGFQDTLIARKIGWNRFRKKNAIGWGTRICHEKNNHQYDQSISKICVDTYFDGFWQNYRYFADSRSKLVDMMRPKNPIEEGVRRIQEEIKEKQGVSLHVRRGDYIGLNWQLSMDYYDKAVEIIKNKLGAETGNPINIYVFSDDMKFAEEYFGANKDGLVNYHYVEYESNNNVIYDMYLTSCCAHNIIANSSYSWWGAWLNNNSDKIVVCPLKGVWDNNFYPREWISIPTE